LQCASTRMRSRATSHRGRLRAYSIRQVPGILLGNGVGCPARNRDPLEYCRDESAGQWPCPGPAQPPIAEGWAGVLLRSSECGYGQPGQERRRRRRGGLRLGFRLCRLPLDVIDDAGAVGRRAEPARRVGSPLRGGEDDHNRAARRRAGSRPDVGTGLGTREPWRLQAAHVPVHLSRAAYQAGVPQIAEALYTVSRRPVALTTSLSCVSPRV
jgi:hypothetical protein